MEPLKADPVSEAVKQITENHHKIIDDWCKVYMAQLYQEGHDLLPGCFTLNEQNGMELSNGKIGKRYWFEKGVPHYKPQEKQGNQMEPPKADMALSLIESIQKSGRAIEILHKILEDDIFDTLSKHNPWWTHEDEKIYEKLDDLRCKFMWVEEEIRNAMYLIEVDPYEGSL